jgi:hypothetical protein
VYPDAYVSFDLVKMFNAQIVQKQQFTNFTTMVLAFLRERPDTLKTSRQCFEYQSTYRLFFTVWSLRLGLRPCHQTARRHHQLLLHKLRLV